MAACHDTALKLYTLLRIRIYQDAALWIDRAARWLQFDESGRSAVNQWLKLVETTQSRVIARIIQLLETKDSRHMQVFIESGFFLIWIRWTQTPDLRQDLKLLILKLGDQLGGLEEAWSLQSHI